MNWYKFSQNNSGGSFITNDKVCHMLYIEAETFKEAVIKAESLGCYWNGVADGIDCPCCGDRWTRWRDDPIDIDKYIDDGYEAYVYDSAYRDVKAEWDKRFGKYEVVEHPRFVTEWSVREYKGKIRLKTIEDYAQVVSDEYGWTVPDARLYYADGSVKEIFSSKLER